MSSSIMHPLEVWKHPECDNPCCKRLKSDYKLLYDHISTQKVQASERKRPAPDFGKFPECSSQGCADMLEKYKQTFKQYLDLSDEMVKLTAELDLHKSTVEIMGIKIEKLEYCLGREMGLLEIEKRNNATPTGPCPECTKLKEILHFLRSRSSHNTEKELYWSKTLEQVINGLKEQVMSLTSKVTEFKRLVHLKEDLFSKDEVVADLRRQLSQKTASAAPGSVDPASFVKIDPLSFTEPGAKEELLSDPYIQKLAKGNPSHVFYDEQRFNETQLQKNPRFRPFRGVAEETVKKSFHLQEVGKLTDKLYAAERELMLQSNLAGRCAELEAANAELLSQHEAFRQKMAQRVTLKAELQGGHFESMFRSFFVIVDEPRRYLDENTMYDAFFGTLDDEQGFIEWMYESCNQKTEMPKKGSAESRAGKKLFAACLWAIGGIYKNYHRGQRYVWINIEMNDAGASKRRKVDSGD
jgi:hypothetical protein